MAEPSPLETLARRLGVLDSYFDIHGVEHATTNDTRAAMLHAMGLDVADESAARRELDRLDGEERGRLLDPVAVVHAHAWQLPAVPMADGAEWTAELVLEDGSSRTLRGDSSAARNATLAPEPLPLGYHELRLSVREGRTVREATQLLVVPPAQCTSIGTRLGAARATGVLANLYSVRSETNWGCGDIGDLSRLAARVAESGGSFVGVNPLHALRNRGWDISPYSPVSRLFRNPIYLDVPALPELAESPEARALLASNDFAAALDAQRAAPLVDYEGVMQIKRRALEPLHRAFAEHHRDRDTPRGIAYRRYRAAQGKSLDRFAIFCALAEQMAGPGGRGALGDWHDWPAPLRDPRSSAVADFARANREAVDLHRYLQFALDEQLAAAGSGLALGVYQDLAVGSASSGCDTWAWPDLFARGATVGAPPDDFAENGQNWGFPPIAPQALRRDRYRYWIQLLRAGFAHGGALRIDHVMGLFRLYWVPEGGSARHGAYVRYPSEEMLAIVALESHRHRAPVVGENLGTVPLEVGPALARWGVLTSAVTYFERDAAGEFLPARDYPARALVSAATHDHVPVAGFWEGRDLEIRRSLGLIADAASLDRARAEREHDRGALVARLQAEGGLIGEPDAASVVRAVHVFLRRTPAAMVADSLDDLALETTPVNVPGTTNRMYPNWSRKMRRPVERIGLPANAPPDATDPAASSHPA